MNAPMTRLSGGFAHPAHDSARGFRAILSAMARPGTIGQMQGGQGPAPISDAAATVLLVLCDRTTPLYLAPSHDTPELRDWIAFHCSAPLVAPGDAGFALGDWAALQPLDRFAIGTPEYPDRAATLIVDNHDFDAPAQNLRGPGIKDRARLALPEVEPFTANHAHFPLGWDAIFTAGARIAALPRSTEVF
ncbi:alpha-D-ribose 1-methylphosphonate 5-triphosphate synthase subunit PhnH [Paracoccus halophilus]|uniref:Alpha-D-ribose 1-methylphosphonate 5-triphosphate synthase subunit PhnH n=1 Tax=Paracoccus halophilus TaxID=376733 RepID=A0A099F3R6_9RHOB|nr:phosphonate C-P lyase system protein PhnH [Paracoccus halophilus]KGJ04832.1 carbon-phosphorus lyase [Paracoccus halophilus]SFA51428.1 alpha-D-ribose 1-methylphosphonate 5-triphosphate synthase subunit PhnH [Paracoccus halophilus]